MSCASGPDSKDALGGHEYYGTVDASPLFVMLLGEAFRWGADPAEIRDLLPAADAALAWLRAVRRRRPRRLRRIPARHRPGPAQPGLEGQLRQHQLRQRRARRAARSRSARCRATSTRRCSPGPIWPTRSVTRRPRGPAAPRRRRCGPSSPRRSGSPIRAGTRSRWTATSARSTRCPATSAHCLWTGIATDEHAAAISRGARARRPWTPATGCGRSPRTWARTTR